MKKIKLLVLITFFPFYVAAQIGGSHTYKFLDLPNAAKAAAMGGHPIALYDNDLNLPYHNPSLLQPEMSNNLVLNYVGYFADIKYGYASYARSFNNAGTFALGLHYIDYGQFPESDIYGNINGNFYANEYAFNIIWAKQLDSMFSVGATLKPIFSHLETYDSYGLALDAGITYNNPDKLFTAALVMKNLGRQISYYHDHAEPLPFEIQLGVSKKLAHAPFRFSLLARHLQKWDLSYENTNQQVNTDFFTGETIEKSKLEDFGDKLARHLVVGVEVLLGDNFHLDFSYNYQRRQELKINTRAYTVGLSWGFGLKISKFHISYGRATYHLAGASNHFSLCTNISDFYRKKN